MFVLFSFLKLNAQTYNYSYTDPCTGNIKNLIVPINGSVTVGYYGFVENFSQQQFTDGTFETWANQVFSQYDGSPCAEIVGLGGQINIGQDVALNTIGIINSLSSLMDVSNGTTDFLSGSLNAASNSSNTKGGKGNKKNGDNPQNESGNNTTNNSNGTTPNTNNTTTNNGQNQTNETSNTTEVSTTTSGTNETSSNKGGTENPTPAGGTSTENGNTQVNQPINNQNQGNENNNSSPSNVDPGNPSGNGNSGNVERSNQQEQPEVNGETTTPKEDQGGGQTNITQGATKTINQNRDGGKPTVIASSDFVGFNYQNSEVKTGLKLTGGYHNMRWDGETARGGLVDYVSSQKGPNMTGYHAWVNKKSIVLLSGTLSLGFEGRGSVYGTIAGGQMFRFPKIKSLKAVYMGTVSYGQVYKTPFLGTAIIAGGMYDLKFGKRVEIKLMSLFVYSPYVSYYNDLVLKSPYVILPSIGTNISITKRFKFNINAGGAWAIKVNTLNYTVTCGTRLLIGQ